MGKRTGRNTLFGMKSGLSNVQSINEEINPMSAAINTTASTDVNNVQETVMNTAQFAFDNARTYVKPTQRPSINMTKEQIDSLSVRAFFEELVRAGRIRITFTANATRQDGIPVVFRNRIQIDQLGRALAMVEHNTHMAWATQMDASTQIITMMDINGENDRAAIGRRNQHDGKIYYSAHYAQKSFNDRGDLIGISTGAIHPINVTIQQRVADYNQWVDAFNEAVRATAMNQASADQRKLLKDIELGAEDPNRFVQMHTVKHINADTIINKYLLEAWLLINTSKPAFEIYSRAKSSESLSTFLDGIIAQMDRSYRSELMKLAGLVTFVQAEAE